MHVQALPWEMITTGVGRIVPRCFFSRHGLSFQSSSSLLFIPRKGIESFIFQTWPFDRTNRRGKFRSYRDESERESEKGKGKDSRTILRERTPAPGHSQHRDCQDIREGATVWLFASALSPRRCSWGYAGGVEHDIRR
jgi:hypothetical protein